MWLSFGKYVSVISYLNFFSVLRLLTFITLLVHQFSSVAQSCPTLWPHEPQHSRPPCPLTNSRSLLKFMSIESVMPSNHLVLCRPLLPPSVISSIRVFSNESVICIRWTKYWSFSFSIRPSNEYSGLISFRMDWLDFLAAQGTLNLVQTTRLFQDYPVFISLITNERPFTATLNSYLYNTLNCYLYNTSKLASLFHKDIVLTILQLYRAMSV